MGAATKIFDGEAGDSTAIITALSTIAMSELSFITSADGTGLIIYRQGS